MSGFFKLYSTEITYNIKVARVKYELFYFKYRSAYRVLEDRMEWNRKIEKLLESTLL